MAKKMDKFVDQETLTIDSIKPENIGTYACNISNEAGYEYKMVYLNILTKKPIFEETPAKRQMRSKGQKAIFRCGVRAYPPASIQWFFEDKEISRSSEYTLLDGDLTIEKVQLHMEGTYECRASNIMGEIRSKSQLTVGNSTKILSGPSDAKTIEGDTVVMDCKATWDSRYNLNIEWRHDGTHLNADDRHIIGNDSLTINNVNSQDKGVYTCVARAKCEKGIEISTDTDSATLTVIESTKIASGPSDTQKEVGGTVVMDCKATWDSRYDLNIEWRHEGDHLNADERHVFGSNSLTINSVNFTDEGVYTCVATATDMGIEISTATGSATLKVTEKIIPDKIIDEIENNYTLIIVMIAIVCALLFLVIMTSIFCIKIYRKKHSEHKLISSQEDIENVEDFNHKLNPLYPITLEEETLSESSEKPLASSSPLASRSQLASTMSVIEETDSDQTSSQELEGSAKMEWDDGVFFQFIPGNIRMFGESFNFENNERSRLYSPTFNETM